MCLTHVLELSELSNLFFNSSYLIHSVEHHRFRFQTEDEKMSQKPRRLVSDVPCLARPSQRDNNDNGIKFDTGAQNIIRQIKLNI